MVKKNFFNMKIPNSGEDEGQPSHCMHCIKNVKCCHQPEKHLVIALKAKHVNCTPGHLSQRSEKLCSHKNVYTAFVVALLIMAKSGISLGAFQQVSGETTRP